MSRSAHRWYVLVPWLALGVAGCATHATVAADQPPAAAAATMPRSGAAAVEAAGLGKMWTLENPPLEYLHERYRFDPSPDWLERVRQAALRYGNGCSASFVSSNGLVMTNHHCARACIAAVSGSQHDYMVDGFYAAESEPRCPGLFLDQLVAVEDVTARVGAAAANATEAEAERAKRAEIERIEEACAAATGLVCRVVPLYHGGIYSLYQYRRYDDVRLVFAPEGQAAFFGGDPDNFTYPRHDLDVSFVRVYMDGAPFHPESYFRWSGSGAAEGELVFVAGNPGSTGRLLTLAQLEYLRDAAYPTILALLDERLGVLEGLVADDPASLPRYRNAIFGVQNSIKAYRGYLGGLEDPQLMSRKRAWEVDFRGAVNADPLLRAEYGGAWDGIARVNAELTASDSERRYTSLSNLPLLRRAQEIVRWAAEMAKPAAGRSYTAEELERLKARIRSPLDVDVEYEARLLARRLADAREALGADHPFVAAALQAGGGMTPEEAAGRIVKGSHLAEAGVCDHLLEGGFEAAAAAADPAIAYLREIDPRIRELEARAAELEALESTHAERVAKALFAVYGTALPPDATFTLRLSDGVVRGYPLNGTMAPYKTTFRGLYDRAASFDYEDPWTLTPRWLERADRLELDTPLDFVCTADIIGGNSGSPVINAEMEVVGLIFDGNMEMLPNRFLYRDDVARAVAVHSEAIVEALRAVYDADALADELEGNH